MSTVCVLPRTEPSSSERYSFVKMNRRFSLIWLSLAIGASCAERFEPPPLPVDARPFGPPAFYAAWWSDVEECAGREGEVSRVRWFVMPNGHELVADGQRDDGLWIEHYRYIVLAEAHIDDSLLVRHEILHDILSRVDHPAEYFLARCGSVVRP